LAGDILLYAHTLRYAQDAGGARAHAVRGLMPRHYDIVAAAAAAGSRRESHYVQV